MIINAGIKRVVYSAGYPDEMSLDVPSQAGIELVRSGEPPRTPGAEAGE